MLPLHFQTLIVRADRREIVRIHVPHGRDRKTMKSDFIRKE